MEKHILSLDYDRVTPNFVIRELFLLKEKFGIELALYVSSKNSYHIRSTQALPLEKCFEIMKKSRCSQNYKDFCKKVKSFPIRNGKKTRFRVDGRVEVKPPPKILVVI